MNRLIYRVLGNGIFAFASAFLAAYFVTGGQTTGLAFDIAAIAASLQGLLAAAQELKEYGEYTSPDDKKGKTKKGSKVLLF